MQMFAALCAITAVAHVRESETGVLSAPSPNTTATSQLKDNLEKQKLAVHTPTSFLERMERWLPPWASARGRTGMVELAQDRGFRQDEGEFRHEEYRQHEHDYLQHRGEPEDHRQNAYRPEREPEDRRHEYPDREPEDHEFRGEFRPSYREFADRKEFRHERPLKRAEVAAKRAEEAADRAESALDKARRADVDAQRKAAEFEAAMKPSRKPSGFSETEPFTDDEIKAANEIQAGTWEEDHGVPLCPSTREGGVSTGPGADTGSGPSWSNCCCESPKQGAPYWPKLKKFDDLGSLQLPDAICAKDEGTCVCKGDPSQDQCKAPEAGGMNMGLLAGAAVGIFAVIVGVFLAGSKGKKPRYQPNYAAEEEEWEEEFEEEELGT